MAKISSKATKANYHNENLDEHVLDILKFNDDGTVDLGLDKVLMVGSCQVADEPKHGFAVLLEPDAVKPTKPTEPTK